MANPAAPTILSPADGSVLVDPARGLFCRKSPFDPGADVGAKANVIKQCTNVEDEDATAGPTWTNEAYFKTGTGLQSTMAEAAAVGKGNVVNWYGLSFGVTTSLLVADVRLRYRAMAEWPATPGYAGNTSVRMVLSHSGTRYDIIDYLEGVPWIGGSATGTPYEQSVMATIRAILGKSDFTVAELEALLSQGSATDATLKVAVSTWVGLEYYATKWHCGPVQIVADYYTTKPDRQTAYQWQFATSSAFSGPSIVHDTVQVFGTEDVHVVRPESLPFGSTLYARVRVWDDEATPKASAYSSAVSFTTLSQPQSRLVNDPAAELVHLVEPKVVRYIGVEGWRRRTAGNPTTSTVYQATVDRSLEPSRNFRIVGIEEEGIDLRYTECFSIAEMGSTSGPCFFWDEDGDITDTTNYPPRQLYLRTSDNRGPGFFKGVGIGVIFKLPWATKGIVLDVPGYGPVNFEGRVLGIPSFTDRVTDFAQDSRATPSGSLVVSNYTKTPAEDPNRLEGGLFDTFFAEVSRQTAVSPAAPSAGWLVNRREIEISIVGNYRGGEVAYADRLPIFRGTYGWPSGSMHQGDKVEFQLQGRESVAKEAKLGVAKFDKTQYPNLPARAEGQVIQEVLGPAHKRVTLTIVDDGSASGNRLGRPGLSVPTVPFIYCGGSVYGSTPTNWVYDATTNHVKITNPVGGAAQWAKDKDLDWTCDCDGALFEGSSNYRPGSTARMLLLRAGIPASDLATATFAAIDAVSTHSLRWTVTEETSILEALRIVEQSGQFYLTWRQDGKIAAVLANPTAFDQNTIILERHDLEVIPASRPDPSPLGSSIGVSYFGYPIPGTVMAKTTAPTFLTQAYHRIQGEKLVETYHATQAAAAEVRNAWDLRAAPRLLPLKTKSMRPWLGYVGGKVALNLWPAQDPKGRYAWDLFQVLERSADPAGGGELNLRWLETLEGEGVPQ